MQIFPDLSHGYSDYDALKEIPNLKGKVAIVTGANSGIGYETVKWLAAKGAKVYLGARDESRGNSAVERITDGIAGHPSGGSVHWLELDVETPKRARAGAQKFLAQESRLDILVHNAGVNLLGYFTTSEGGLTFNKVMSINHLGTFVLTQELLPVLKRTAMEPDSDVRVIVVSSRMHKDVPTKPEFRTLEGWNAINGDGFIASGKRYMASKLANVLFIKELQSRLDAEKIPITCLAINPGLVNTGSHEKSVPAGIIAVLMIKLANVLFIKELQSRLDAEKIPITCLAINPGLVNTGSHEKSVPAGIIAVLMMWFARNFGLTSEQGSFASLFAATAPEIKASPEKWKGGYVEPYNRWTEVSAYGNDKQLAKDLWACSEEVTDACLRDG
ncbi:hypothetical protein M407DRAFT_213056 [Tulasnella calospora MUT 4182]|uniref:Uncharacterized protein n=1 Tax=Tulasnella calospora MUT 4182 TaxID=1051891 RepID=A0A0C3QEG2_9AGAM|nr:hypothetical protein M407DRAFT_213056 [Tulasnella calospora MUT 4182]